MILVDDDAATLRALQRILRDEPYALRATDDPGRALEWVGMGDVRLVLSDQRMPGMLGSELLTRVLERSPATACALISGYPEGPEVVECLRRGVKGVIAKPWDDRDLRRRIRDWVGTTELLQSED